MVRLAPDQPLRHEDILLVRTKLRSPLDRTDLIKNIHSASSSIALIALSPDRVPDLLQTAVAPQPENQIVQIKRS